MNPLLCQLAQALRPVVYPNETIRPHEARAARSVLELAPGEVVDPATVVLLPLRLSTLRELVRVYRGITDALPPEETDDSGQTSSPASKG